MGDCCLTDWLMKVCFALDVFIHIICFSYECNVRKKKKKFPEMVIPEAPRIIIKMMYANMIIPFIMSESTLIAVIAVAMLGSFRAAAIPFSF